VFGGARYEISSVRVHLRDAVDSVNRPAIEVHLDLQLPSEKLMALRGFSGTHASGGKIQRRDVTEPLRDRKPRHPDVHHRDAGDEPHDEDEPEDDPHPPMQVNEDGLPVEKLTQVHPAAGLGT